MLQVNSFTLISRSPIQHRTVPNTMESSRFPDNIKTMLSTQILSDPGLPRSDPTVAAWQVPPHSLSEVQSTDLPQVVDFAIIGSGVTGCSVAKTLLENSLSQGKTVTIFEARTITSGATGRNGGHLISRVPSHFKELSVEHGREMAIKISRFCTMTLEKMAHLAMSEGPHVERASEIRKVQAIIGYEDERAFLDALASVQLYEDALPQHKGRYSSITQERATKVLPALFEDKSRILNANYIQEYHLKDTAGALSVPAYAFWPYRLIVGILERLIVRHSPRFTIEAKTPVTAITLNADPRYPYTLVTPRGPVLAAQVFHCANAFTGHLLPALRGKIFPYRLTMSGQNAQVANLGAKYSWLLYKQPRYDPASGILDSSLYYIQQNAATGDLFCGGDRRYIHEMISSDDGEVSETARSNHSTLVSKLWNEGRKESMFEDQNSPKLCTEVRHMWSGIIGMTPDSCPLVGKVPRSVSGRQADGEWVAAGFNGYGMAQCWSSGEAVARMALGEPTPEWLPEVLLIDEQRLSDERRMGVDAALGLFQTEYSCGLSNDGRV